MNMRTLAKIRLVLSGVLPISCLLSGAAVADWTAVDAEKTYTVATSLDQLETNPLRGLYRWRDQQIAPLATMDAYDRFYWSDLEPREGEYDFSSILDAIAAARSRGQKFAFRIRAMGGYEDGAMRFPSYLVGNPNCRAGCVWASSANVETDRRGMTYIPDWNDPFFIERARLLLQALAAAIEDPQAIAWIDIGMYGQWGEWVISSAIDYRYAPRGVVPITEASKREYIDMHLTAFPDAQLVAFAVQVNTEALDYALNRQALSTKPVGLRVDCVGERGFFEQWRDHPDDFAVIRKQWRKAPFVAEFCFVPPGSYSHNFVNALQQIAEFHISAIGNGNMGYGATNEDRWASYSDIERNQLLDVAAHAGYRYGIGSSRLNVTADASSRIMLDVVTRWRNLGNAPTYESWRLAYTLVNDAGVRFDIGELPVNLKKAADHTSPELEVSHVVALDPSLPVGQYRLEAKLHAVGCSRPAMKLANPESVDGTLVLGTIEHF